MIPADQPPITEDIRDRFLGYSRFFQQGCTKHTICLVACAALSAIASFTANYMSFFFPNPIADVVFGLSFSLAMPTCVWLLSEDTSADITKAMLLSFDALRLRDGRTHPPKGFFPSFSSTENETRYVPRGANAPRDFSYSDFCRNCSCISLYGKQSLAYQLCSLQKVAIRVAMVASAALGALVTVLAFKIVTLSPLGIVGFLCAQLGAAIIGKEAFVLATENTYNVMLRNPDLFFRDTDSIKTKDVEDRVHPHLYKDLYITPLFLPNFWPTLAVFQ